MTWEENVKIYGEPIKGKIYNCKLRQCWSKQIVEEKLIWIHEDDVAWRTASDNSEISYNWDVIEWRLA